jgi:hypothetical protein
MRVPKVGGCDELGTFKTNYHSFIIIIIIIITMIALSFLGWLLHG